MKTGKQIKLLFTVGLLFTALAGFAQNTSSDYIININARSSVSDTRFNIHIERKDKFIKIVYAKFDSINYTLLKRDKEYLYLHELITAGKAKSKGNERQLLADLGALVDKHACYTRDSLVLKADQHQPYKTLLNSVLAASPENLTREAENRNRIILDGTMVHVTMQLKEGATKDIYVHAPESYSHPEVYALLTESLNLHRSKRPNSFLDRSYTNGY